MKTMYRPLWEGVQNALGDIFVEGHPADKVIQFTMKANRKWGSHDRKLFAESLYDMVRWWRRLLWVCEIEWPEEDKWTESNAVVFAEVTQAWCHLHDVQLGTGVEPMDLDPGKVKYRWNQSLNADRAVRWSIPNWLDQFGSEQLGEKWAAEVLPGLNSQAPVFLRVNRLKTTPEVVVKELKDQGVKAELVGGEAIRLTERANIFLSPSFTRGFFEVQDQSSQAVVPSLLVEPGMRVIDACAGAGGKTLHLAALMKNKGKIIAMDVTEKKLEELRRRSTRAGASIIETRLIESTKVIKRLDATADRLLLDVPCSGSGVLRRNPDAKWKLDVEEIKRLVDLQADILHSYSKMCKPGGYMVYASCSVFPIENEKQIEGFLKDNPGKWEKEEEVTLYPKDGGGDGFYHCRLKRL